MIQCTYKFTILSLLNIVIEILFYGVLSTYDSMYTKIGNQKKAKCEFLKLHSFIEKIELDKSIFPRQISRNICDKDFKRSNITVDPLLKLFPQSWNVRLYLRLSKPTQIYIISGYLWKNIYFYLKWIHTNTIYLTFLYINIDRKIYKLIIM